MPRGLLRRINKQNRLGIRPWRVEWGYVPTERQREFHRNGSRFKLYGGAMGGGKSVALCAEAIKLSLRHPGNRGYMCRQELVSFRRSTLVTFERFCPSGLIRSHHRDDRIITFRNGSEIIYGGLGGEEDLEKIKSTEFGWFAIDEATETFEEMFLLLTSRLRWILPLGVRPKYRGILASNPEPGWVKEMFVDQRLEDHAFIPALPRDNPYLPKDYDARLRKHWPEEWVNRYLNGSWDVFEGQIYSEFMREKHIVNDVDIGEYWTRFRVIDHGYTNPTCCLWIAIDHDGAMWIYDEHYQSCLTIPEHAHIIKAKEPNFRGVTLCDPSMFSRTMQKQRKAWSPADEYREHGIVVIKPYAEGGHVSEGIGITLVKSRLKEDKLKIKSHCANTIREILKYRWQDLKASVRGRRNSPEVPVDKDNHAMDCLRYANMWKPVNARPPEMPLDTRTLHYAIMKHKKQFRQPFMVGWQ